jgi:hypothetical protein
MLFMIKSKQRRDYIASEIRASLSDPDGDQATAAADSAEIPRTPWQRFTYQLPAWGLLLAFAAVPAVTLIILLNR